MTKHTKKALQKVFGDLESAGWVADERFQVDLAGDLQGTEQSTITIRRRRVIRVRVHDVTRLVLFILLIISLLSLVSGITLLSQKKDLDRLQTQIIGFEDSILEIIPPLESKEDAEQPLSPEVAVEFERLNARIGEIQREAKEKFDQELKFRLDAQLARAAGLLRQAHFARA